MKKNLFIVLLFGTLIGCTAPKGTMEILERAELQMNEHPDSAKILLESVDRRSLRTRRARARFALLYSQALDKNYIDVDQDSLAQIATRFYRRRGTANEKALAYYYRGRVYENASQVDSALIFYNEAEQFVAKTDNFYLKGLIAGALADMYLSQRFRDIAQEKYIEAAHYFEQGYYPSKALMSYIGALGIISSTHNYQMHEYLLDYCDSIATKLKHTPILLYIAQSRTYMIINRDANYKLALNILHTAIHQDSNAIVPSSYYPILTKIYTQLNVLDSAAYYARLWSTDKREDPREIMEAIYFQGKIHKLRGNSNDAYKYAVKALRISDSLYHIEKEHAIPELKAKYKNEQLALRNEYLSSIGRYQRYVAGTVFILFFIITVWIIRNHRHKIRLQIQEIAEYRDTILRLKNAYETLQYNQSATIDPEKIARSIDFLQQLLDIASTYRNNKDKFQEKIEQLIMNNDSGQKGINQLFLIFQDILDLYCPGIVAYISRKYAQLNSQELTLYCMICLSISKSAACLLMRYQPKTYYNSRNRLRNKLHIANDEMTFHEHFQQMCAEYRQNRK